MKRELVEIFIKDNSEKGLDINQWKNIIDSYFEEYVSLDECDTYDTFCIGKFYEKELWQVVTVYHNDIQCYPFWVK